MRNKLIGLLISKKVSQVSFSQRIFVCTSLLMVLYISNLQLENDFGKFSKRNFKIARKFIDYNIKDNYQTSII